jgi:aldehyde dehydrogenase (NAD+)
VSDLLDRLSLREVQSGAWTRGGALPTSGRLLDVRSPIDGSAIGRVRLATAADLDRVLAEAVDAFARWRLVPGPRRGEIVRQMGEAFRAARDDLGALISWEVGKIRSEGLGEVVESIDMADFAVGLSRQLYGLTMASERPGHRMFEQWHPLGVVGVITAFNFPNAVWAWNALVAAVCGDAVVWKPSLKAPLTALATHRICHEVLDRNGFGGLFGLVIGDDAEVGEGLIGDPRVPLVSATGSCRMGRHVHRVVAGRLARCLLELGGNNAIVVEPDADLDLAIRAVCFGAVGTAGQRCTTTRRLFLHRAIADAFLDRLIAAYRSLPIGDPREEGVLVGPLIDEDAVQGFLRAIASASAQGGVVLVGGRRREGAGCYVEPTVVRIPHDRPIVHDETFAPILYVDVYDDLADAIAWQNEVAQGLSSSIFTGSMRAMEAFLGPAGSDCGIANVNIGTSGAEIGGAFGGEKETGGGREAGSDSWKSYMRRQTCTVNGSRDLPLAQGVRFDV